MKHLIHIFCLLFFAVTQVVAQKTCKDFKVGKFELTDTEAGHFVIERNEFTQIEYSAQSGIKVEFIVNWTDECTYTLELKRVIENPNNYTIPNGLIMTVKITEAKARSYVQQTTSNLNNMVLEKEFFKMM